jgi:hypothetical protein
MTVVTGFYLLSLARMTSSPRVKRYNLDFTYESERTITMSIQSRSQRVKWKLHYHGARVFTHKPGFSTTFGVDADAMYPQVLEQMKSRGGINVQFNASYDAEVLPHVLEQLLRPGGPCTVKSA